MKDLIVKDYLPELEQNSNRFPEREFFFGVLSTLKPLYLTKIVEDANKVRYEADANDPQKDFIMLDTPWYEELMKYPYFSSKLIDNLNKYLMFRKTWQSNIPHEAKSQAYKS